MSEALVICDDLDCSDALEDLEVSLQREGISLIKAKNDFYDNPKDYIKYNDPFLFYRNPYIRILQPKMFLDFAKSNNYNNLYKEKEIICLGLDFFYGKKSHFAIANDCLSYYRPQSKPCPIICFGHHRLEYLKLSLNSIKFSLMEDEETPILLGMSAPNEEYKNFCFNFKKQNKNVVLYETKDNSALAMINLIIQDFKPDKFIILEEDFILPQLTKFVFPYWTKQYSYRLDHLDLVAMITDVANTPYDFFNIFQNYNNSEIKYLHRAVWHKDCKFPSIGSGLGLKTSSYIDILRKTKIDCPGDGTIKENSIKSCQMQLQGYHIGWNQEMDGYANLLDFSRFTDRKKVYTLINHNTNTEKIYNLEDLSK